MSDLYRDRGDLRDWPVQPYRVPQVLLAATGAVPTKVMLSLQGKGSYHSLLFISPFSSYFDGIMLRSLGRGAH